METVNGWEVNWVPYEMERLESCFITIITLTKALWVKYYFCFLIGTKMDHKSVSRGLWMIAYTSGLLKSIVRATDQKLSHYSWKIFLIAAHFKTHSLFCVFERGHNKELSFGREEDYQGKNISHKSEICAIFYGLL